MKKSLPGGDMFFEESHVVLLTTWLEFKVWQWGSQMGAAQQKKKRKEMKDEQWPQGGTSVHVLVTGMEPKRAVDNSTGGTILVENDAAGLTAPFSAPWDGHSTYISRHDLICPCQRNCRLLTWMKPQTKHRATRPLCKQISLCSRAKGLKIPQTGYEARCWGWRTPTSDKRICSINATVARQWGRKRGSVRRACLRGRVLIVYGCDLADKRLNLSGTGYPHGTSVCQ